VFEEDAGGDLLFEGGARQEMVIHAIDLTWARRPRRARDHAADRLRVSLGEAAAQGRLPAAGGP
jgi:hypothetical protein